MTKVGQEVGRFKVTEIRLETNKQFSALGTCLACGFERALITAEVLEDVDEEGEVFQDHRWRCWCPKCDANYWWGDAFRTERMNMPNRPEIVAAFLYGRAEYMRGKRKRKREDPTTKCWICEGTLADDGTSIWANCYFGLHKTCAPRSVTEGLKE